MHNINRLRIMTFNIRGGNNFEDGINTWSYRAALNVKIILRTATDIIGFQECQAENLEFYRSSLIDYSFYLGHIIDRCNYNPIFWKTSHFDFVDGGQFWLSPVPGAVTPSIAWNSSSPRSTTWVRLRTKNQKLTLLFVNTHWDHISEEARWESACLISKKVFELTQDGQLLAVVVGDFNCSRWRPQNDLGSKEQSTNEPYCYLIKQGFIDCFLAAGNIDSLSSNTFHGFMGEDYMPWRHHMLWRADWILLQPSHEPVRVQSCSIVRDGEPPLYPSDYYPVVADLVLSTYS